MKKRIMSLVLAAAMVMSLGAGFSAGAVAVEPALDVSMMSVSELAHLDTKTASPALKEAILDARTEIIYGDQAWTVDGAVSIIDLKSGEVTALPEFSDLFPGWDIPEIPVKQVSAPSTTLSANSSYYDEVYNEYLKVANSAETSKISHSFNGDGTEFGAFAETSTSTNPSYNIGFTNLNSNSEMGWVPGLPLGKGVRIGTNASTRYGVRASVTEVSQQGSYRIRVTNDPSVIDGFYYPSL